MCSWPLLYLATLYLYLCNSSSLVHLTNGWCRHKVETFQRKLFILGCAVEYSGYKFKKKYLNGVPPYIPISCNTTAPTGSIICPSTHIILYYLQSGWTIDRGMIDNNILAIRWWPLSVQIIMCIVGFLYSKDNVNVIFLTKLNKRLAQLILSLVQLSANIFLTLPVCQDLMICHFLQVCGEEELSIECR